MDVINFFKDTVTGPPEPPEPPQARREPPGPSELPTYQPQIHDTIFYYALKGPDEGWYIAMVEKEPFPGAYTLTINKAGDPSRVIYRDVFMTWRGNLRDEETLYVGFSALVGEAIKSTTGSIEGWSMITHPVPCDEIISLDPERESIADLTDDERFSFQI